MRLERLAIAAILLVMATGCGSAAAPSAPASGVASAPAFNPPPTVAADWGKLLAAARQEGKVVLGVPPGPQYQPAISEAFKRDFPGVDIEITNIVAADFTARLAKERAAGQYAWDAWIGGPDVDVYQLAHQGAFDPIKPEIILPDVLNDSKWLNGFDKAFSDQAGLYTFNMGASASQNVYANRDFVPESVVSKWDDLWKPELKGKIVWQDPRQSGSGVSQAAMMLKVFGESKLRELWTDQQIALSTDERQMADWVARGVHPIGVGLVFNRGIELLQQQGVGMNIKTIPNPLPQVSPAAHGLVAINKSPHPNARKLLLNWLLSQEGQTILARAARENSRRLDVPIVDPPTQAPQVVETINAQSEAFAPYRRQANQIAAELFNK